MFNSEQLQEKWSPLLNHEGLEDIKDPHRKAVTAVLLENQERFLREERDFLYEGTPGQLNEITNAANAAGASGGFSGGATAAGPVAGFDPRFNQSYQTFNAKLVGIRHMWRSTNERPNWTHLRNEI